MSYFKSFILILGVTAFVVMILFFPLAQTELGYVVWKNKEKVPNETFCISGQSAVLELCVPKLQIQVSISQDADIKNINSQLVNGVTHLIGTAEPGSEGNAVFFGHSSGYIWEKGSYKTIFANLNKLQPGDDVYFTRGTTRWRYQVRSIHIVSPQDISVLNQDANKKVTTLITCWPPGTTIKRLVVRAQLL